MSAFGRQTDATLRFYTTSGTSPCEICQHLADGDCQGVYAPQCTCFEPVENRPGSLDVETGDLPDTEEARR